MKDLDAKTSKVDKYLTDIKELPPSAPEAESKSGGIVAKKQSPLKTEPKVIEKMNQEIQVPDKGGKEPVKVTKSDSNKKTMEESKSIFTFKDIILGAINFVSVILLIFLLTKLPLKAQEFQTERIKEIRNQTDPASIFGDISHDKERAEELNNLFLDESGVVDFVNAVEKLKGEGGAIQKIVFASQKTVKDAQGLVGYPVVVELRGNWQTIGASLQKIQALPFLFRPITAEAVPAKDDPSVIVFSYGGLLYIDEKAITQ